MPCYAGDLVRFPGWGNPLEKGKASSILAWRIPGKHDWMTFMYSIVIQYFLRLYSIKIIMRYGCNPLWYKIYSYCLLILYIVASISQYAYLVLPPSPLPSNNMLVFYIFESVSVLIKIFIHFMFRFHTEVITEYLFLCLAYLRSIV